MNLFELAIVVSAVDRATSVLNGVKGAINSTSAAGEKMQKWGQQATAAGALVTAASQQIMSGFQSIIQPANDVEDSLAKVHSVLTPMSGTMTDALGRMQSAAVDWSTVHKDAASKFLDTTYMMISAGLNETASIEATRTAMLVAKATMGESTDAANLIGGAYNTIGNKAKPAAAELTRLGDVVTKTQQLFQFANFNQLSEGLKNSTAGALATGLSFEQLNTVIGTLNSNQLQGAEAGTSLKAAMLNMSKASTSLKFDIAKTSEGGLDFIGTLANIEKKYGSLKAMSPKVQEAFRTAFGDEGNTAISLLLGKSGELSDSLAKVKDSAGAAAAAAAIMGDTGSSKAAIMANQVVALKVAVAAQLQPTIAAVVPYITQAFAAMSKFVGEHPQLVRVAGVLAAILMAVMAIVGPILMAVGAVGMFAGSVTTGAALIGGFATALGTSLVGGLVSATMAAWSFAAALMANPITWIVLAIVAAAALIYIYWEPIKKFFVGLWNTLKTGFQSAWASVLATWSRVTGFFNGIWSNIRAAFQESFIKGILTVISYLNPVALFVRAFVALWPWLKTLPGKFVEALGALGGVIVGAASAASSAALGLLRSMWSGLQGLWASIVGWFSALPARAISALVALGGAVVGALSAAKDRVFGILSTIASTLSGFFLGGFRNDFAAVTSFVGTAWQTIKTAFDGGIMGVLGLFAKFSPVALIMHALDAVTQWLFGFSLFAAGSNILNGLTAGIRAAASGPIEAVTAVVQRVRNLLPFSPAKEGPLRDLHRVRIIETIASTVRATPLVNAIATAATLAVATVPQAATNVASLAVATVPQVATNVTSLAAASVPGFVPTMNAAVQQAAPIVVPLPAPAAQQQPDAVTVSPIVNFYISGNADASTVGQLEKWARENSRLLYSLVERQSQNEKRGAF